MGAGASAGEEVVLSTLFTKLSESNEPSGLEKSLVAFSKDGIAEEGEFLEEIEVASQEEFNEEINRELLSDHDGFRAEASRIKMISGDCVGLSSLVTEVVSTKVKATPKSPSSDLGLSIPNNIDLDDGAIESFMQVVNNSSRRLLFLNIGGSSVKDLSSVTGSKPLVYTEGGEDSIDNLDSLTKVWIEHLKVNVSTLVVVDLSYAPQLNFDGAAAFGTTPHLRRLVLDGCNITSTTVTSSTKKEGASPSPLDSIFFGLVSLLELSLVDCALATIDSLNGFSFFGSMQNAQLQGSLMSVNLADNPLRQGTAALSKEASERLVILCGRSLVKIDGKAFQLDSAAANANEAVSQLKVGRINNDNIAAGFTPGGGDLDAADREFTQALKGEKDNTVVA
jgi:hypothetical protein